MAKITKIKASDTQEDKKVETPSKKTVAEAKSSAQNKNLKQDKKSEKNTKTSEAKGKKASEAKTSEHSAKAGKKLDKKAAKADKKAAKKAKKAGRRIPVISYVKESFAEIRQVRWPNRKETWKMTLSVIGYVLLISIFIMLLDVVLELIFKKILMIGQ